eukprot:gene19495-biopygen8472
MWCGWACGVGAARAAGRAAVLRRWCHVFDVRGAFADVKLGVRAQRAGCTYGRPPPTAGPHTARRAACRRAARV